MPGRIGRRVPHCTAQRCTGPRRAKQRCAAGHRAAPHSTASHRIAPPRNTPPRSAPNRTAPRRAGPLRSAPFRSAPLATARCGTPFLATLRQAHNAMACHGTLRHAMPWETKPSMQRHGTARRARMHVRMCASLRRARAHVLVESGGLDAVGPVVAGGTGRRANDLRTLDIRRKPKALQVVSYMLSTLNGLIHDQKFIVDLQGGCCATKRRIDLRQLINNTMLCIEINEDQHNEYIKRT